MVMIVAMVDIVTLGRRMIVSLPSSRIMFVTVLLGVIVPVMMRVAMLTVVLMTLLIFTFSEVWILFPFHDFAIPSKISH
jgi:hypothetical protein